MSKSVLSKNDSWPGFDPRPLVPESSVLTVRSLCDNLKVFFLKDERNVLKV